MKISKFVYFIFLAPVIMKLIEWSFQLVNGLNLTLGLAVWQILFLGILSFIVYTISTAIFDIKLGLNNFAYIPAFAYFLKEVYNFVFIAHLNLSNPMLIALIVEPIFMGTIVGYFIPLWLKEWRILK